MTFVILEGVESCDEIVVMLLNFDVSNVVVGFVGRSRKNLAA